VFVPVIEILCELYLDSVLFITLPGYAFIAALFPDWITLRLDQTRDAGLINTEVEKPSAVPGTDAAAAEKEEAATTAPSHSREGIDGIERVALSFGLSIAIVPLIGLVLNFTPWGSD